jgi:hypothetical protein
MSRVRGWVPDEQRVFWQFQSGSALNLTQLTPGVIAG